MPKVVSDQVSGAAAALADGELRPVVGRLSETVDWLGCLNGPDAVVSDVERVDRIAVLERLRAAVAAAQAEETVRFAQSQVAVQRDADVDPLLVGRGIADQVALACKLSPTGGSNRFGFDPLWWTPPRRGCSLWEVSVGSSLLSTRTRL